MYSFRNDYSEGAHPKVLKALTETNFQQTRGYGLDPLCQKTRDLIRSLCAAPDADVHFLVGGTQTNLLVIESMLKPYEAVISAHTGHINVHETGAVEATGRKILALPTLDGKLTPAMVESVPELQGDEHQVKPAMLYISDTTEVGTVYTREELEALRRCCDAHGLLLFLDGARLGYGLMSRHTDVTLQDIARLCDVFYIGGTKVGALCGEAVVFTKQNRPPHFINSIKKRGALLAKGRLLGLQFDTLFTDNLYFEISRHAIEMAEELKKILEGRQIEFYLKSPTNQQFVILENDRIEKLKKEVMFSFWEKYDGDHTVIRFVTSWATAREDLAALDRALERV